MNYQTFVSQNLFWLIGGVVVAWLVYLLAPVLTPFAIATLLAYLGDPLADRLEKWGLSRTMAVVIVFSVLTLIGLVALLLVVPLLQQQLMALLQRLPEYVDTLQNRFIPWFSQQLGLTETIDLQAVKKALLTYWQSVGSVATQVVKGISESGLWIVALLGQLVLIPVVVFYLLRDWDILMARIRALLPRSVEPRVVLLATEVDEVLAAFLRGQLTVMLALGSIYALGLWLVGLDFALLIGMIAGLISFVPYLGSIVGILLAGTAAMMQFQDIWILIPVAAVFAVGQTLEGFLLTPLLIGDRIGLHPVAVIFALMAGAQLFGFVGMLLALPVAAAIMVLLRHVHDEYLGSHLYDAHPANNPGHEDNKQ